METTRRKVRLAVLLSGLALVLGTAGCGADDSGDSGGGETTTEETTEG